MMQLPPDPYKILGIAADATLADIRAAHRKLVKQCHPDKVSAEASDDEKREKEDEFKRVQKAYELLSDDTARANYDEKAKMYKRFQSATRVAAATAAFASPPRRAENWPGPGVNAHVRNAEPRPDSFSSRSPPKEAPRQYHHRASREFEEQRANVKVERDAQPKARRGASYDTHPSPTEDVTRMREEELQRKLDETKRELRELEKEREKEKTARAATSDREKEKKPSKSEKPRSEKPRKEEKSRSSKKDNVYVEDPDEPYKSGKSKSSSKSAHKSSHRPSKHRDRSSSRSVSRSRHPTKKSSREKTHLCPEVEEPDDTESDIPHNEKFIGDIEAAIEYQRQAGGRRRQENPDLRRAYTDSSLPQRPSVPTPPPVPNPAGPKPTIIDVNPNSRSSAQAGSPPGGFSSPPRAGLHRTHTQPAYNTRTVPIGPDMETYYGSPGARGRSRSRLNQGFYAEDDEAEISGGQRSRRGSSNTYHTPGYTTDGGNPSRMYTVRENPMYYDNSAGYYPPSGHSPKGYSIPIHNGPPSGARVVPFGKMSTVRSYTHDDVTYANVPHTSEDYPYVHA